MLETILLLFFVFVFLCDGQWWTFNTSDQSIKLPTWRSFSARQLFHHCRPSFVQHIHRPAWLWRLCQPGSASVVGLKRSNVKTIYLLLVLISHLKGHICWDKGTSIKELHWKTIKVFYLPLEGQKRKDEPGEPKQMQGEHAQMVKDPKNQQPVRISSKNENGIFLPSGSKTSIRHRTMEVLSFHLMAAPHEEGKRPLANDRQHWSRGVIQLDHPTYSSSLPTTTHNTQLTRPGDSEKPQNCVCPVKTLQWKLITRWGREPVAAISTA